VSTNYMTCQHRLSSARLSLRGATDRRNQNKRYVGILSSTIFTMVIRG